MLAGDGPASRRQRGGSVAHPSDDQRPRLGAQRRLRLAVDAVEQLDHAEGDGRGGPPRRRARPEPFAERLKHGRHSRSASTSCPRPANGPTTRSRIAAQRHFTPAARQRRRRTPLCAGRLEDRLFLRDRPVAGRASGMQTVSLVVRLVLQLGNAATCHIYPSTIFCSARSCGSRRRRLRRRRTGWSRASPTDFPGRHPDSDRRRRLLCLRRHAVRPVDRPLHPGPEGARLQGRVLSVPARDRGRLSVARPDHLFARHVQPARPRAVAAFLGSATHARLHPRPGQPDRRLCRLADDWTYRRMILHYANLCVIAGGVNLFLIGSELRGLETIRGPAWTPAGTTDARAMRVWDYPFVAGLQALAADVRAVFDGQGLTKNARDPDEPRRLFGRLVGLDGVAARRGERAVAPSRFALGGCEHRCRRSRQLPPAVGLDDRRRRSRRAELALSPALGRMAAVARRP